MNLLYRSEYLLRLFQQHVKPEDRILEIGCGDNRNVNYLKENGYPHVEGIDKLQGTPIELVDPKEYDVIFTMSTLFLIPPENDWVFKKIAGMAKKTIITVEGETTDWTRDVYGRNYADVFRDFGFEQVAVESPVFNQYGVARVLKRND